MNPSHRHPSSKKIKSSQSLANAVLFALLGCTALALVIGGFWFYQQQAQAIRVRKSNELQSIAELKISQITQWRQERTIDARMNSTSPFITQAIDQWLATPGDGTLKTQLLTRLQMIVDLEGYQNVILATPAGQLLLSLDPTLSTLEANVQQLAVQASRSAEPVWGDFFRSPETNRIVLDVAAPILDHNPSVKAVLIMQIDPEIYLYPLIQSWPTPSQSAETLLVQKEGTEAVYLNTLRFRTDPPLTIRVPLTRRDVPAVQAGLGQTGEFEGLDYRGVNVIAEILPVPGTPWFMEAKVDTGEILAEVRALGGAVLLFILLAMLMTAALAAYAFNYHQRVLYQNLFRAEQERHAAQEEIRATLYSIGDGVITTDKAGRVTRLNPVAENLTGWSEAEAKGQPLAQVFRIVSEISRTEAENPSDRVLREGVIVGLANHTLLLARDGTARPIADSGAPIWAESGSINGVVLVFRDQTQERAAQKERALLNYTIATSLNEIYLFDADTLRFRFVNAGALKNLGYSLDQLRSMTPVDLKPEFTLESFKRQVQPLLEHAKPALIFETLHRRADASHYPVEVHLQLFEYEGERVFLAVINDITARKQAEKTLQENEARLEQAQALAQAGNWEIDLATQVLWASPEAFRIYGLERILPTIPMTEAQNLAVAEDRPRLDAALEALLCDQGPYDVEFRIQRAGDAGPRIIHSVAEVERDDKGGPLKVRGIVQDVTDRKQAELALRESETRYRALFQNNHAVMLLINPDTGAIVEANPAATDYYGWTAEELTRMTIGQINTLPEEAIQQEMQLARSAQHPAFLFQHRKRNGAVCDVEVFSGPIQLHGQTFLYSIVHDITERIQAEAQVTEQMAELRRWHTATLGREMRILELKGEVNALLSQAGLPPRYASPDHGESV